MFPKIPKFRRTSKVGEHEIASVLGNFANMDAIDAKLPDPIEKVKFKVKKRPKTVLCPRYLLRQLRAHEELLSKSTGSLPYRHQIQLNAITEALAVLRGDTKVRQGDIDTVAWLSNWINYDFEVV